MLRTGIFRSPLGLRAWNFWKTTRNKEFVDWFEQNIIDQEELEKLVNEMNEKDPKWKKEESIIFRIDD